MKARSFLPLLLTCLLCVTPCGLLGQVDPSSRSILFIRGAPGSGGATEGGTFQQRTEQLSDIFNLQTNAGNHGWGMLGIALVLDGFQISQLIESPAPITTAQLAQHRIVVMGSNNKVYTAAEVAAFHAYIDQGGSALFISDANWGLTWEAAPASDNQFLARYGAQVYQDSGQLPVLSRSEPGRYIVANHPVLSGPDGAGGGDDVNDFQGEGVSLFRITSGSSGYQALPVVSAQGLFARLNNPAGGPGNLIAGGPTDCAAWSVSSGDSRLVGLFDRNTFFNQNGAGTDIYAFDNAQLAINVFRYLAAQAADLTLLGGGCGQPSAPILGSSLPVLGTAASLTFTSSVPNAPSFLFFSIGLPQPFPAGNGCVVHVRVPGFTQLPMGSTGPTGSWSLGLPLPSAHQLAGLNLTLQALVLSPGGPFLSLGDLSNGLKLRFGF